MSIRVKLGDVCQINWGDTSKTKAAYTDEGYPAFSASGRDGYMPHFDHESPGIVLSAIGAKCGKTWYTEGSWSCIKNTILLKAKEGKADARFIYYATQLPDIWPIRGAAQPFISQTDARAVEIDLPDRPTQRGIAGILSAYDDLIENNLRRIRILKKMAQSLYREWFVHFRFPGHESVPLVDSPLGPIPEGWVVKSVEEAVKRFSVGRKYNQKTVAKTGVVPVLDQGKSGIIGYHNDDPGFVASEDEPVIVFANHTCYQRIVQFPFSAIQNVLPFRPDPELDRNLYWLHWATKDLIEFNDYKGHWPEFIAKNFLIPPSDLCDAFGRPAEQSVRAVFRLERRNQNLRQTRDLLLPKLLSPDAAND